MPCNRSSMRVIWRKIPLHPARYRAGVRDDMVKYAPSADKPLIQAVFQIHPPSTGEGEQEVPVLAREEGALRHRVLRAVFSG